MASRYTDGTYLADHADWHEDRSAWKAEQVVRIMERNAISPETIVDIGCGAGAILRAMSKRWPQAECLGIDPSPDAIALAETSPEKGMTTFRVGLVSDLDSRFDVALALDVFEHVDDYLGFLRTLKDEVDRCVFHIPLDLTVLNLLRSKPLKRKRSIQGHLHYFNRQTALETLEEVGFTVVDSFYTASHFAGPGRSIADMIRAIPRRALFRIQPDFTANLLGGYSLCVLADTRPGAPREAPN